MKTDKEYPATHSMSTAWYIADEDGNVGILDFDDNGPVPYNIGEHTICELVIGVDCGDEYLRIKLTDSQIYEIIGKPLDMKDVWWSCCVIEIYPERTDEFLSLVSTDYHFIDLCISKKLGIYRIYAGDYVSDDNVVIANSLLDNIIERGLIKHVYRELDYSIIDIRENNEVKFEKDYDTLPYYIYSQPYWIGDLIERVDIPTQPVKVDQLPEKLRDRVIHIPIKFKGTSQLQIAEWLPCKGYDDVVEAYGCGYISMLLPGRKEAYCLSDILLSIPMPCDELARKKVEISHQQFAKDPTVIAFHRYTWDWNYYACAGYSEIIANSLHTQYLPDSLIRKQINSEKFEAAQPSQIKQILKENTYIFEYIVNRFKPHLLLIDDDDVDIISSVYSIDNHTINVQNVVYPIYAMSEVEANSELLTELAKQTYRGTHYPMVMSVDEMQKINTNQNKLCDD